MNTLQDFMIDQLQELYSAELQLKMQLEKMAFKASNEDLRHSFERDAKASESQLRKLDRIFGLLGQEKKERYAHITEGLGNDLQSFMDKNPPAEVLDAGFIAFVQKGKHYKIAICGAIREYARQLNHPEAEQLLSEILEDEKETDRKLTERARSGVNERASDKTAA